MEASASAWCPGGRAIATAAAARPSATAAALSTTAPAESRAASGVSRLPRQASHRSQAARRPAARWCGRRHLIREDGVGGGWWARRRCRRRHFPVFAAFQGLFYRKKWLPSNLFQ